MFGSEVYDYDSDVFEERQRWKLLFMNRRQMEVAVERHIIPHTPLIRLAPEGQLYYTRPFACLVVSGMHTRLETTLFDDYFDPRQDE